MHANGSDYKRINFQLPTGLASQFEVRARKAGTSKAKLLKQWLLEFQQPLWKHSPEIDEWHAFNFRVDIDACKHLQSLCGQFGVSQSVLLRWVINQNLVDISINTNPSNRSSKQIIRDLWKQGRLKNLTQLNAEGHDKLDFEDGLITVKAYVELGEVAKAQQLVEQLSLNSATEEQKLQLSALTAKIAWLGRDLGKAKAILQDNLHTAFSIDSPELKASTYDQLSVVAGIEGDWQLSMQLGKFAHQYVNAQNYPRLSFKVLMHMAGFYARIGDFGKVTEFMGQAKEILDTLQNSFHSEQYWSSLGAYALLELNPKSEGYLQQALKYNTVSGSDQQRRYHLETLGRIATIKFDYDSAYKYYAKSEELEFSLRAGNLLRTSLQKEFSAAHSSLDKMQARVDGIKHTFAKSEHDKQVCDFVTYAADYLFAKDNEPKRQAAGKLAEMTLDSRNITLRQSANMVLEKKVFIFPK